MSTTENHEKRSLLFKKRFHALGGFATIYLGAVFAYAGTAFGPIPSLNVLNTGVKRLS